MIMRSRYNPHLQKQQQQKGSPAIFLPILCSASSVKDVILPSHCRRSSSSEEEPSSPTVGCMGQVKRTNKVVAFPSTLLFKQFDNTNNENTGKSIHNNITSIVKRHKLKRFFSPKSLTYSPATAAGTHKTRTTSSRNHVSANNNRVRETGVVDHHQQQHGRVLLCRSKKMDTEKSRADKGSFLNLEELDPPLPVVKRPPFDQKREEEGKKEENLSLWKRRSGGTPLKTLQVQVIHPNSSLLPANTL